MTAAARSMRFGDFDLAFARQHGTVPIPAGTCGPVVRLSSAPGVRFELESWALAVRRAACLRGNSARVDDLDPCVPNVLNKSSARQTGDVVGSSSFTSS